MPARFGFSSSGLADDFTYNGIAMSTTLQPVHPIELFDIQAARERIAGTIVRTPLVRLELGTEYPDIRLKLENLQPINAYKLRGAVNAERCCPSPSAPAASGQSARGTPAKASPTRRDKRAYRAVLS